MIKNSRYSADPAKMQCLLTELQCSIDQDADTKTPLSTPDQDTLPSRCSIDQDRVITHPSYGAFDRVAVEYLSIYTVPTQLRCGASDRVAEQY